MNLALKLMNVIGFAANHIHNIYSSAMTLKITIADAMLQHSTEAMGLMVSPASLRNPMLSCTRATQNTKRARLQVETLHGAILFSLASAKKISPLKFSTPIGG